MCAYTSLGGPGFSAATHVLKSWPVHFGDVLCGCRTAEVRINDRNYRAGDLLFFKEWNPDDGRYTGRECMRRVAHVLRRAPGLQCGYVVLSMTKVNR